MTKQHDNTLVVSGQLTEVRSPGGVTTLDVLTMIPEEQVWLDGLKTANTRNA
jgi:hypothetical protein